uniref:Uncharacterized protein n=1 Tax=Plectus sambesii TaxID=2011161 RepID=A0A914X8Q9_9BILA
MPQLDGPMFAVAKEEDLQRSEHQKVLEEMENLEHKYEYEQRRESAEFNSTMERQQSLED